MALAVLCVLVFVALVVMRERRSALKLSPLSYTALDKFLGTRVEIPRDWDLPTTFSAQLIYRTQAFMNAYDTVEKHLQANGLEYPNIAASKITSQTLQTSAGIASAELVLKDYEILSTRFAELVNTEGFSLRVTVDPVTKRPEFLPILGAGALLKAQARVAIASGNFAGARDIIKTMHRAAKLSHPVEFLPQAYAQSLTHHSSTALLEYARETTDAVTLRNLLADCYSVELPATPDNAAAADLVRLIALVVRGNLLNKPIKINRVESFPSVEQKTRKAFPESRATMVAAGQLFAMRRSFRLLQATSGTQTTLWHETLDVLATAKDMVEYQFYNAGADMLPMYKRMHTVRDLTRLEVEYRILELDGQSTATFVRETSRRSKDPFSSEAYKWSPARQKFYSVGPNGKDESAFTANEGYNDPDSPGDIFFVN